MIYVSTSCVRHDRIKDSVLELAKNDFQNIELSGGTKYYENFESDLLELKDKYNLNYRCHNYFPPPKKPFVLNLASLNDETFQLSFHHIKQAITFSRRLGSDKFSFHAGFFVDIRLDEIGKQLSRDNLFDKEKAIDRFCKAYDTINTQAKDISLFIENNVFSKANADTYDGVNPFMMTNFGEYNLLKEKIDFNLLLDIAHLKVSANTMNLDWEKEFKSMLSESSYVHVSDNNGLADLNNEIDRSSDLLHMLRESDTKHKDFTLEVYDEMDILKRSYAALQEVVCD